MSLVTAIYL